MHTKCPTWYGQFMPSFSQRNRYARPPEISVREELPQKLRRPIAQIAARRLGSKALAEIVQAVLDPYGLKPPSQVAGWAVFVGNGDADLIVATEMLDRSAWFHVYDVIEAIHEHLARQDQQGGIPVEGTPHAPVFEKEINKYFVNAGIGWQLVEGEIVTRGGEVFENTVTTAVKVLERNERPTSAGHLRFALSALSARPKPNTTGAVAHATSAVECVLGEITGKPMTLGKYLDKHPALFHPALKKGLDGIYGYASDEGARHGKEGTEPTREEAEFTVAVCAATCTLLTRKHPK
jgi:hypothetical protein